MNRQANRRTYSLFDSRFNQIGTIKAKNEKYLVILVGFYIKKNIKVFYKQPRLSFKHANSDIEGYVIKTEHNTYYLWSEYDG